MWSWNRNETLRLSVNTELLNIPRSESFIIRMYHSSVHMNINEFGEFPPTENESVSGNSFPIIDIHITYSGRLFPVKLTGRGNFILRIVYSCFQLLKCVKIERRFTFSLYFFLTCLNSELNTETIIDYYYHQLSECLNLCYYFSTRGAFLWVAQQKRTPNIS